MFAGFESRSLQQIIYQIGKRMLNDLSPISEIHPEGNNRTSDTIAEQHDTHGVYIEARLPYGCLGLTLTR